MGRESFQLWKTWILGAVVSSTPGSPGSTPTQTPNQNQ